MPNSIPVARRRAKACENCNKKKIRCQFLANSNACDSCAALEVECVSRLRKKRSAKSNIQSDQTIPSSENRLQEWDANIPDWSTSTPQIAPWANEGNLRMDSSDRVQNGPAERAPSYQVSYSPVQSNTTTFIGRSHYISQDIPIDEASARAYGQSQNTKLSETQVKTLQIWDAFDVPPRAARQSLIDTYMQRCYPWTPILQLHDLEEREGKPASLLLSQAVFLAASRVSSAPGVAAYASSEQFYQRAKALFWQNHEKNPVTVISATVMLHWYNPDGPEHLSFDTSAFWLQIAVGISRQIGLHQEPSPGPEYIIRRRLWWSLVARDCLISAGQGRPRAISLKDADVKAPCLDDFPESKHAGELFISYVQISIILATLTESCLRKNPSDDQSLNIENALFRWTRTLPKQLRICQTSGVMNDSQMSPYNFEARQLHVPYFIALAITARSKATNNSISPVALLASSFVAGIFEDFLARDEQQFLGPIFTFYLLAAGVALLAVRPFPALWAVAQNDLEVIQQSLTQLSSRWPSVIGAGKALQNVMESTSGISIAHAKGRLSWLDADQLSFFEGFSPELCRLWHLLESYINTPPVAMNTNANEQSSDLMTAEILGNLRYPGPPNFGNSGDDMDNIANFQYDGIGNW